MELWFLPGIRCTSVDASGSCVWSVGVDFDYFWTPIVAICWRFVSWVSFTMEFVSLNLKSPLEDQKCQKSNRWRTKSEKLKLTMDFLWRNSWSFVNERRALSDLIAACALMRACILWRVAAALFLTRKPRTRACNFTNPFRALNALRACDKVTKKHDYESKLKPN